MLRCCQRTGSLAAVFTAITLFRPCPAAQRFPWVNSSTFFYISGWWSWQLFWPPYWSLFFPPLRERDDTFLPLDDLLQLLPDQGFILGKGSRSLWGNDVCTNWCTRRPPGHQCLQRERRLLQSVESRHPWKAVMPPSVYWSWSPSWLSWRLGCKQDGSRMVWWSMDLLFDGCRPGGKGVGSIPWVPPLVISWGQAKPTWGKTRMERTWMKLKNKNTLSRVTTSGPHEWVWLWLCLCLWVKLWLYVCLQTCSLHFWGSGIIFKYVCNLY